MTVKRSEVIEDGLFDNTIQGGLLAIQVIHDLTEALKANLQASKEAAKSNPLSSVNDIKAAIDGLNGAKTASEGLAAAQKKLDEVTESLARDFEKEEQLLKKIKGEYAANILQLTQYKSQLKALTEQKKSLTNAIEMLSKAGAQNADQVKDLSDEVNKLTIEERVLKQAASDLNRTINAQTKENIAADDSMDAIAQRLGQLKSAYRSLSKEERGNIEVGGVLLTSINQLDTEIKELDASIGNHQRNVGNYSSALDRLPLGNTAKMFLAMAAGEKAAKEEAKSLGKQFLKLAMNPIVLILTALVGTVMLLFKAFTKTDEGGTKFSAMMEALGAIMDVVMQRVGMLAGALTKFFSGDFTGAAEQFGQAISGVGDQLQRAASAAHEYIMALDALEDAEIGYISQRATAAREIAELEFLAQDRTQSIEIRKQALQDALRIGEEELAKEKEFADRRLELELEKAAALYNISTESLRNFIAANDELQAALLADDAALANARNQMGDEGQKALEEFYTKSIELDTKFFEENKRNQSRLTGFEETVRKEREEKAKAFRERQLQQEREYQDLLIENMKEGFEKQIAVENLAYERRKVDLADNHRALEQLEILHQRNLAEIIKNRNVVPEEIEAKQRDINDVMKDMQKTQAKLLTETGKGLEAYTQKVAREQEKQLNQAKRNAERMVEVVGALDEMADKKAEKRVKRIDEEIDASKKRADELRMLAIQGDKNAQDSIALEEKRQAELERKKELQARKAARRELGVTAINTYNSKVQGGDKNALGSTIKDLGLLMAFVNTLPAFFEGTENVAESMGKPHLPGRDGYLIRADGSERIIKGSGNALLGDITNDDLVNIGVMYKNGMLMTADQAPVMGISSFEGAEQIVSKLDEVNENLKNIPKNNITIEEISDVLTYTSRSKNRTTITKKRI